MNAYTLEPSKSAENTTDAAAAAVAAQQSSAPLPLPQPQISAPTVTYPSLPYYMPSNYQYYAYQHPQAPVAEPAVKKIHDWLPWSIVNIFLGGIIVGLIPLIFSLICRSKKTANDTKTAQLMSTLALVFNILITLFGILSVICILIYVFVLLPQMKSSYYYTY